MRNRVALLTVDSSRPERAWATAQAGPTASELLADLDATAIHRQTVAAELDSLRRAAVEWCGRCDVLLIFGGIMTAPEDLTPEAVAELVTRPLPGLGEAIRQIVTMEGDECAPLMRCGGGLAGETLVLWLPEHPRLIREILRQLAPAIRGVCKAKAPASAGLEGV